MNAPPPSEARIIARIGVGSAVTVAVNVSVAGRVAGVEEGLGVREAVLKGAALTGVAEADLGENVFDGIARGVGDDSITVTGSGGGDVNPIRIMTQSPTFM